MAAVWPDIHVGEGSLFQSIREIRDAQTLLEPDVTGESSRQRSGQCRLAGRTRRVSIAWHPPDMVPGGGRTHMALAAAYQQLGRTDDAKATMAMALKLRPGSTVSNVQPPTKDNSAVYLRASERVVSLMVAAGLPE